MTVGQADLRKSSLVCEFDVGGTGRVHGKERARNLTPKTSKPPLATETTTPPREKNEEP